MVQACPVSASPASCSANTHLACCKPSSSPCWVLQTLHGPSLHRSMHPVACQHVLAHPTGPPACMANTMLPMDACSDTTGMTLGLNPHPGGLGRMPHLVRLIANLFHLPPGRCQLLLELLDCVLYGHRRPRAREHGQTGTHKTARWHPHPAMCQRMAAWSPSEARADLAPRREQARSSHTP